MKANIVSGSALAAAIAPALNGASMAPAHAHVSKTHAKALCGGKGSRRHKMRRHHETQRHHHKASGNMKGRRHSR